VKIVNVVSPNSNGLIAGPDVTALAQATNSLDQFGDPYLEIINGDGSGLSVAILDAIRSLVGDTRRDVSLVPEDDPSTIGVNEAAFVKAVVATSCPTTGIQNCLGGQGTDTCESCLAETQLGFSFRLGNAIVVPTASPQVFDFYMVAVADGTAELSRVPVRVMVPEAGTNYGAGFYENTYDSDVVCVMPPDPPPHERPDWGILSWAGSTPSDSRVTFEFFTADDAADLDTVIPVSLTYCTDAACPPGSRTDQEYDIGQELFGGGELNYQPYLRVRARLEASTDSLSTPVFQGWSMQFDCVPSD